MSAAGDVTRIHDLQATILQAKIAGIEAASTLLAPDEVSSAGRQIDGYRGRLEERVKEYREHLKVGCHP